ncbi:MAG: peptide-methionine (R)-S-oxide reductase MsrB [Rectinemataceae bacterium]
MKVMFLSILAIFASLFMVSCARPIRAQTPPVPLTHTTAQGVTLMIYSEKDAQTVCYIQPTEELKAKLSPEEYAVLVQAATEPPFQNPYWDNHREGIYVDRIDGTPLFASTTKFDSGTGWPSFWQPIDEQALVLVEDRSYGMYRIEVRSRSSGGHLGHLFDDGPAPTGLRYCINSASLRFVPREDMEKEGYGSLLSLFSK